MLFVLHLQNYHYRFFHLESFVLFFVFVIVLLHVFLFIKKQGTHLKFIIKDFLSRIDLFYINEVLYFVDIKIEMKKIINSYLLT